MPQMNGVEFFEEIKNISPSSSKILVTGHAEINTAIDAINRGNIFRFITKPFEMKILQKAIEDGIHQYKLNSIEKSDLLKNEFLNIISHEIRTPLSGITNFISLIKEELDSSNCEKVKPYFDIIEENRDRLIRTIHLMMDISLVMSGTVKLNYESFNLVDDVLHPLLHTYVEKAKQNNNVIDLNIDSKEYKIISDKYCIQQILSNLLNNAIAFTNNGIISITISSENSQLIIEICDNGIGMNEDFQKQMFDAFIQEDSGLSRLYDGNGLGLTLVKGYCDLLNISYIAKSKKRFGTTFRLQLKRE